MFGLRLTGGIVALLLAFLSLQAFGKPAYFLSLFDSDFTREERACIGELYSSLHYAGLDKPRPITEIFVPFNSSVESTLIGDEPTQISTANGVALYRYGRFDFSSPPQFAVVRTKRCMRGALITFDTE